ncbi:MAG: hypothetical protein ABI645_12505 [Pseudomonadota bacterium]
MNSLHTNEHARNPVAPVPADYSAAELLQITLGALNARPRFRLGHVEPTGKVYPAGTAEIRDSYLLARAIERCMAQGVLTLEARELAAVLAGLRALQEAMVRGADALHLAGIATDGDRFPALSAQEIDRLCERLNAGA